MMFKVFPGLTEANMWMEREETRIDVKDVKVSSIGIGPLNHKYAHDLILVLYDLIPVMAPPPPLEERLKTLIADRRIIEAIRLYRQETGLGLRESKEYIDKLRGF